MANINVNKFAKGSLTFEDDIREAFTTVNNNFTTIEVIGDFDGTYASLTGKPLIPSTLSDLGITDGSNGQILQTDGNGNFTFVDKPAGGGGGDGFANFDFGVAADDSTIRQVTSGESIKFAGGGDISTSSDAEGNITISYTKPSGVSAFVNDANYLDQTSSLEWARVNNAPTTLVGYGITDAATSAQGVAATSAVQPGDNVSGLANDAGYITTGADIDFGAYKILYSNVYANLVDLPSASTYHGMFAHVHATGKGYFAHSGNWIELANSSDVPTATSSLTNDSGFLTTVAFADLTSKPTTISGYGITDAFDGQFGTLTNKPTTIAGYGITNAATSTQGALADSAVQPSDNITSLTNNAGYISGIGSLSVNALSDVDTVTTPPTTGQVLKWNGSNWAPGADATTGGAGTDADTLDGFDSAYFLNYNNLANKPTSLGGELVVAADDSTEQIIGAGEVLQIAGGTNVTTSSDAEGKITISASISTVANATEADTVKTIQQSGLTGNHFLTFVPDDNITSAAETIYTDAGVTFDPNTNALNVTGNITAGTLNTHTIPVGTGTLALTSDIPAAYTDSDVDTHLNVSGAGSNEILSWSGTDYAWISSPSGIALTDLSVSTAAAGTAALTYASATGVFTYTPPDLSTYIQEVTTADFETGTLIGSGDEANYDDTEILTAAAVNNLIASITLATVVANGDDAAAQIAATGIRFEGTTADDFETFLVAEDVGVDRTITLPNATGQVALVADIPTTTNELSNNSGFLVASDLSGYATQSYVTSQGFATESYADGVVSGYATQSYVNGQGFVTSSALSTYATQNYVTTQGYLTTSGVDNHLNFQGATAGEVLSWTGTDYNWVAQSGGGSLTGITDNTTGSVMTLADLRIEIGAGTDFRLSDTSVLQVGDGGDLSFNHDSANSWNKITSNAMELQISTTGANNQTKIFGGNGGGDLSAVFQADGAVELYHNTVKKFETTSTGVTVTGSVIADTFETTSTGTATLEAATNLNLDAGDAVVISNSVLRLKSYTTTQRNALTAQAGDVIYNTSNSRVEFYENGAWSNSHTTHTFSVVNNGASAYTFSDTANHWFPTSEDNPVLYLRRGETYVFDVNASTHPFEIRASNGGAAYSTGVTNNAAQVGEVVFSVPMSAPATLYYQCTVHASMGAVINIV